MQTYSNGKSKRRERIKSLAQESARKYMDSTPPTISVENPYINGVGGRLNVFDVFDGRPRILLIEDELPKDRQTDTERATLHAIKWNCDPIGAVTLVLNAIPGFREEELNTLNTIKQLLEHNHAHEHGIAHEHNHPGEDIIPPDYVIEHEIVSGEVVDNEAT